MPDITIEATPSTALAIPTKADVPTILAADTNDLLGKLKTELSVFVSDPTTDAGRTKIRSMARKIGSTKVALIEVAGTLTENHKKIVKAVAAEVKAVEAAMDALRDKLLEPVTAYEQIEKARVAAHQSALAAIARPHLTDRSSSADLQAAIDELAGMPPREWQEFATLAAKAITEEIARLVAARDIAAKREADEAELKRLREEAAERARIERERAIAEHARKAAEKLAQETLERAEREARQREEALKQAAERQQREAAEALERERAEVKRREDAAEKQRLDAIAAAEQAERDRVAAAQKAEQDRIAAKRQADLDAAAAVERERQRAAAEVKRQADEDAARAKDTERRRDVHREIMAAITDRAHGITADHCKTIVAAMARGEIPHVTIKY